ncbi:hypothetical protein LPJ64_001641 [Coemansia asiatica]|uniref:Glutathione S-transferase n=1 Tax=Coemansia asiatica TaxID=1052880 RepID=A0A9W8CLT2_9FUNG|nr:hypothetical protein LPJ64_001641 [Coemansia asiatica]KAJ2888701.1 hypothetical protein FB639_000457 [Coemansia asiatica]
MSSSSTSAAANEYPYEEGGYTLYSAFGDPFSLRSLRALSAAKVPYKLVGIDFSNLPSWYHLVNPQLKLPSLRLPSGEILTESLVISEFVADQFPEAQLLPKSAIERAQLRLFVEIFTSRVIPNMINLLTSAAAEEQDSARANLLATIKEANDELAKQWERPSGKGGPLWLGDKFSLAEINTVSFVKQMAGAKKYRGLVIPQTQEYAAFNKWVDAFSAYPEYLEFSIPDDVLAEAVAKFFNLKE